MTLFFRNLGLLDGQAQLKINELNIQGEEVVIEAEVESETLQ
jgi:hypothetical protein